VEDTTNGGKVLGHYNIDSQTPMDVIFFLKRDTGPVVEQVLSGDATLSEKLETLRDLPGSLITKLMHKGSLANSEIPPLASLSVGYNHIILGNVPSETAFEYKNRLHLRDVSAACEIYFKDRWLELGWNLQLRPMGNWVIVTPDNEPVLQRTSSTRSKLGYNWNARNGQ
jgi:hypothetical protein